MIRGMEREERNKKEASKELQKRASKDYKR